MKKVVVGLGILLSSAVIISCGNQEAVSKYPGYKEIGKDLYFSSVKENAEGRKAEVGDILSFNMSYSINNDSVIFDTKEIGQAAQLKADTGKFDGDLMGALLDLKEGDSALYIVNANTFFMKTFGMRQSPEFIDSTDLLYFYMGLTKVQTMAEMQAEAAVKEQEAMAVEKEDLAKYIAQEGITVEPTASGMYFISLREGTGKQAEAGKTVKVNYEGQLINGKYFDTSIEEVAKAQGLYDERRTYAPLDFQLGTGRVIRGWDEGIAMLKEGGKARLIIPSDLGYGGNPRPGIIQPYNTLIFDVELIEVSEGDQ